MSAIRNENLTRCCDRVNCTNALVAGACHWFNPLVWFIISRLRAAMEAAADRLALSGLSQGEAASYGELLLRMAESGCAVRKSPTLGLLPFASVNTSSNEWSYLLGLGNLVVLVATLVGG